MSLSEFSSSVLKQCEFSSKVRTETAGKAFYFKFHVYLWLFSFSWLGYVHAQPNSFRGAKKNLIRYLTFHFRDRREAGSGFAKSRPLIIS